MMARTSTIRRTAAILLLVALTAAPAGAQTRPQPAVPAGGQPLPDRQAMNFNKAFSDDLDRQAKAIEGTTDPNGNAVSPSTIKALVLTRNVFVADMQGYVDQLDKAQGLPIAEKNQLVRTLVEEALDVNAQYKEMIRAQAAASDIHGEQKRLYQEFMKQADELDKAGPGATDGYGKDAKWFRDAATNSAYGWYVEMQRRFYKTLQDKPLFGIRKDGTFLFQALLEPDYLTRVEVYREIFNNFIDATRAQARADMKEATGIRTLSDLWKFGGLRYSKQHVRAATFGQSIGATLPALHISELEAVFEGYAITKEETEAFWNSAKDLTLGVIAAGSMLIPVAGPFIAAGVTAVQITRDGDDLIVAYLDEKDVKNTAAVTGYTHVITAEERTAAAAGKFVFTVVTGLADVAAIKNVKFVRGAATTGRETKQIVTATDDAVRAARAAEEGRAAANATRTATATAEEAKAVTAAARNSGLTGKALNDAVVFEMQERVAIRDLNSRAEAAIRAGVPEAEVRGIVDETMKTVTAERGDKAFEAIAQSDLELAEKTFRARNPTATFVSQEEAELVRTVKSKAALEATGRAQTWSEQELAKLREMAADPTWTGRYEFDNPFNIDKADEPGIYKLGNGEDVANIREANRRTATQTLPKTGEPPRYGAGDRAAPTSGKLQLDLKKAGEQLKQQTAKTAAAFGDPLKLEGLKPNQVGQLTDAELARVRTGDFQALPEGELKTALAQRIKERSAEIARIEAAAAARVENQAIGGATALNAGLPGASITGDKPPAAKPTPTGSAGGASSAKAAPGSASSGPLTKEEEKKASEAMLKADEATPTGKPTGLTAGDEKKAADAMLKAGEPTPTPTPTPTGGSSGLTKEEEKKASDAMLKADGAAPGNVPAGGVPGKTATGMAPSGVKVTITPSGLLKFEGLNTGVTYPGLFGADGSYLVYGPGTTLDLGSLPPPILIAPPTPLPTGNLVVGPDGSVMFSGVSITTAPAGGGTGKIGDNTIGNNTTPGPPSWPAGPVTFTPGGLIFRPPTDKEKAGAFLGGGDAGGGGVMVGGGGLPPAPQPPNGPGFGFGDSESFVPNPVEPHLTAGGGDPGVVELGGGFGGDPGGCCFPGVQSLMFTLVSPVSISAPRPQDDDAPLPWAWAQRSVAGAIRALVDLATPAAARRAFAVGNAPVPLPPALAGARGGNAAAAVEPGALKTLITSLGTSQGDAFDLQIINQGAAALRVAGSGVVVQPLKKEAQEQLRKEFAKLVPRGNAVTQRVEAYCLAFGLAPPSPGMLFQIAGPDIQQKFAPARAVLQAGQQLSSAGLLHPDSNPKAYLESIKQYAVWSRIENWDVRKFTAAWVEKTRQNALALKRNWTREMENTLMSAAPGRWRDIEAVLSEAAKPPASR